MKTTSLLLASLVLLAGCGTLVPKKVELFQDKVKPFPEQSAKLRELEREAIYRASDKTAQTLQVALLEGASTNVIQPAQEARVLTRAVAVALGPPLTPSPTNEPAVGLAEGLESAVAGYNVKLDTFKAKNNENEGKKIEGTGLFQISYIYWIGGAVGAVLVVLVVGKLLLTAAAVANPGAAVGLNVVNAAESVAIKGFNQLVKGGEDFKGWVEKEVTDSGLKQKILDAFSSAHQKAQDTDVQNVVAAITK